MSQHFDTVALIGIGLIGSSISHAVRRGGLARRIVGAAKTEATRATALRLGLVDEVFASSVDAVKEADLVILCVPVGAMGETGATVASAASGNGKAAPELYIEFRKDGKPIDPTPWWSVRVSGRTGNDT